MYRGFKADVWENYMEIPIAYPASQPSPAFAAAAHGSVLSPWKMTRRVEQSPAPALLQLWPVLPHIVHAQLVHFAAYIAEPVSRLLVEDARVLIVLEVAAKSTVNAYWFSEKEPLAA